MSDHTAVLARTSMDSLRKYVRAKPIYEQLRKARFEVERLEKRLGTVMGSGHPNGHPNGHTGSRRTSKQVKNKITLRAMLASILKSSRKPMTAMELAKETLKRGFKTTSKKVENFKINVANVLRLNKEFAKKSGKYSLKN